MYLRIWGQTKPCLPCIQEVLGVVCSLTEYIMTNVDQRDSKYFADNVGNPLFRVLNLHGDHDWSPERLHGSQTQMPGGFQWWWNLLLRLNI